MPSAVDEAGRYIHKCGYCWSKHPLNKLFHATLPSCLVKKENILENKKQSVLLVHGEFNALTFCIV